MLPAATSPLTWRSRAHVVVDGGAGTAGADGDSLADARGDLGDPEREQLLVGVDDLVVARGGEREMRMESEKATRKTASAAKAREPTSPRLTSGIASRGRPLGTGPVIETPWLARSSAHDMAIPATTRTSAPGIRLFTRPATTRRARDTAPTTTVTPLASPRWRTMSTVSPMAPSSSLEMPSSFAELAEDEHDGDPGDVADQHRLGEGVGDPADAGHACHEVDHPHHDREHRRQRGVLRAPADGNRSERRRDQQRDGALGPDGHPRRGTQEGVRQHREEQRIETGGDRHTGQLRVRHGCRHRQRRHRDPSEHVGAQPAPRVAGHRPRERHVPRRHRRPARRRERATPLVGLAERLHLHTRSQPAASVIARRG